MKTRFYAAALLFFPFLFPQPTNAQTAKSLLWEISGNGLAAPSYLYGTMHVGDKRAHNFSDATMNALHSATAYAGELNMDDVDQLAVLKLMKLDSGQKLHSLFQPEEWTRIETYCKERVHVNPNDFDDYNIFFLYSLVAQSQFKNQKGEAVDIYFYKEAKKSGKKLLGLEKVEEQMAAIKRLSLDEQRKMLLDAVDGAVQQQFQRRNFDDRRNAQEIFERVVYREQVPPLGHPGHNLRQNKSRQQFDF